MSIIIVVLFLRIRNTQRKDFVEKYKNLCLSIHFSSFLLFFFLWYLFIPRNAHSQPKQITLFWATVICISFCFFLIIPCYWAPKYVRESSSYENDLVYSFYNLKTIDLFNSMQIQYRIRTSLLSACLCFIISLVVIYLVCLDPSLATDCSFRMVFHCQRSLQTAFGRRCFQFPPCSSLLRSFILATLLPTSAITSHSILSSFQTIPTFQSEFLCFTSKNVVSLLFLEYRQYSIDSYCIPTLLLCAIQQSPLVEEIIYRLCFMMVLKSANCTRYMCIFYSSFLFSLSIHSIPG